MHYLARFGGTRDEFEKVPFWKVWTSTFGSPAKCGESLAVWPTGGREPFQTMARTALNSLAGRDTDNKNRLE